VYLAGGTKSDNFPSTIGSAHGNYDIVVVKVGPTGQVAWSSRIGGPNYDRAYGVEVDPNGDVVIAGRGGKGFPVTPGALQTTFAGGLVGGRDLAVYGEEDGAICKLSGSNGTVIWCTYFGADDYGAIRDVALDAAGNIYISAWVDSDYPTSWIKPNAYQKTRAGDQDLALARIATDGSQVVWCTYLGGSLVDGNGPSLRVLPSGDLAFVMSVRSADIPTPNGFDHTFGGGIGDMYVGVMSSDGSTLRWGTYLGGNNTDATETHDIALDSFGNIIIAAASGSTDYPTVGAQFQPGYGGGMDGVLTKFSSTGTLLASAYFGGSSGENFQGVAVGRGDTIYVSGSTHSASLPGVTGSPQGVGDAFTARFTGDFSKVIDGFRVGGSGDDLGRDVAVGPNGEWYMGGMTASADWPSIPAGGGYNGGLFDAFVVAFGVPPTGP
jgi:hypothetical protein